MNSVELNPLKFKFKIINNDQIEQKREEDR